MGFLLLTALLPYLHYNPRPITLHNIHSTTTLVLFRDDLDQNENPEGLGGGSVRVATVLMYLSGG